MADAPERIWLDARDDLYDNWTSDRSERRAGETQYIRANLHAAEIARLSDALRAAEARADAAERERDKVRGQAFEEAAQDVEEWADEEGEVSLCSVAASIRALATTDTKQGGGGD